MSDWNTLARALRQLHHALLQRARGDYAREHGIAEEIGPGELLSPRQSGAARRSR
ncbi:MAG TPA: hypothetical protein VLK85_20710 [Ramlibacter sp.]|nr:hypothetical protein [Ramlibacter sp.]